MDKVIRYFEGDELASHSWVSKYALKDKSENIKEEIPTEMHLRLANEWARVEYSYAKNTYVDKSYGDLEGQLSNYGRELNNKFRNM